MCRQKYGEAYRGLGHSKVTVEALWTWLDYVTMISLEKHIFPVNTVLYVEKKKELLFVAPISRTFTSYQWQK